MDLQSTLDLLLNAGKTILQVMPAKEYLLDLYKKGKERKIQEKSVQEGDSPDAQFEQVEAQLFSEFQELQKIHVDFAKFYAKHSDDPSKLSQLRDADYINYCFGILMELHTFELEFLHRYENILVLMNIDLLKPSKGDSPH